MKKEIIRQIFHLLFGSTILLILVNYGILVSLLASSIALFVGSIISFQIKQGKKFLFTKYLIENVEREHEKRIPGKGAITMFAGITLTQIIFYFNPIIIVGALIVLVFGDFTSTLAGKIIGKHKTIGNRTLEGSAAGITVSFIYLSLIFSIPIALITAIIGMLAELIPFEDNLTIPIITGLILTLLL